MVKGPELAGKGWGWPGTVGSAKVGTGREGLGRSVLILSKEWVGVLSNDQTIQAHMSTSIFAGARFSTAMPCRIVTMGERFQAKKH